jgi:tRNA:m4X modification enzyme
MEAGLAEDARCRFVLPRKNRRCGLLAAPGGGGFCGNHQPPGDGGTGAPLRVPCPVDPSHTVLASKLAQHVKKCPKATEAHRLQQQSFFRADCNRPAGGQDRKAPGSSSAKAVRARMEGMKGPDFEALVARVAAAASRLGLPEPGGEGDRVECLAPVQLQPWITGVEWLKSENRVHEPRHAVQRVSIAAHVAQTAGLWGDTPSPGGGGGVSAQEGPELDDVSVVELGAGRGYVGAMLAEAGKVRHCVLNDVRSYRNKADRVLRKVGAARVERATCDLKDFCLAGMDSLQDRRCVVVGKHLCGGATDLALRCIADCRLPSSSSEGPAEGDPAAAPEARPGVLALGIATCCHHRCTLDTYVGAEVLGELGFAAQDLEHIFWLSSWATLKGGAHGAVEAPGREDLYFSSIPLERRVETGRRCKQLLDAGRLEWLRRRGYKASGVRYVTREVTPENYLLVGH